MTYILNHYPLASGFILVILFLTVAEAIEFFIGDDE